MERVGSYFRKLREDFRQQYKEKHPNNKSVAAVGKAGGDKWKHMSTAEKAPYEARAGQRNKQRNKDIEAYNKILAEASTEEDDEEEDDDDDER